MPENYQQIKIEQLESVSFGDNEFKKELIEIFLNQMPDFILNMNRFYSKGDLIQLAKEAHTAKSSVMIFGMNKTGESLKEIQLQAEENKKNQLADLILSVETDFKKAREELEQILGGL